jgi:acyl dehydratase
MRDYKFIAQNFSESSENKIHSDEMAKKFGFKGALVPGVAVYGHLSWPLVDQHGPSWLEQSVDSLRLISPAYHGDNLTLNLREADTLQTVDCHNPDGELLAQVTSASQVPEPEYLELLNGNSYKPSGRVEISWDTVNEGEIYAPWNVTITPEMNHKYTSEVADEQEIFAEFAHPHLLLSLANNALMSEYIMPTWLHVGSETRRRAALKVGDTINVRAVTLDKWQKKGHEFIRTWVTYWRGEEMTTDILHTAIFKVAV